MSEHSTIVDIAEMHREEALADYKKKFKAEMERQEAIEKFPELALIEKAKEERQRELELANTPELPSNEKIKRLMSRGNPGKRSRMRLLGRI